MSIIEKLKDEVEAIGCPFFYQSQEMINILLDNARFPACYAFLINSGNAIFENGRIRERIQVALFFVKPTEYDFESFENEAIIQLCKVKADKLVFALSQSSTLKLDAINNTQRLYDEYDCIVTGYGVNLTIEELEGVSTCDFPTPTITTLTYMPALTYKTTSGKRDSGIAIDDVDATSTTDVTIYFGEQINADLAVGDLIKINTAKVGTVQTWVLVASSASSVAEFATDHYTAFNTFVKADTSKTYRVKLVKSIPDTAHLYNGDDYVKLFIMEEYCEC